MSPATPVMRGILVVVCCIACAPNETEFERLAREYCEKRAESDCPEDESVKECVDAEKYRREAADEAGCVELYDVYLECVAEHGTECSGDVPTTPEVCFDPAYGNCLASGPR